MYKLGQRIESFCHLFLRYGNMYPIVLLPMFYFHLWFGECIHDVNAIESWRLNLLANEKYFILLEKLESYFWFICIFKISKNYILCPIHVLMIIFCVFVIILKIIEIKTKRQKYNSRVFLWSEINFVYCKSLQKYYFQRNLNQSGNSAIHIYLPSYK